MDVVVAVIFCEFDLPLQILVKCHEVDYCYPSTSKLQHKIQDKNVQHSMDLSPVTVFDKMLLKAKMVFWFYTRKTDLVVLYCYNCDHKFYAILAFFCHDWNENFPILGCNKLTAVIIVMSSVVSVQGDSR